jgi:anti-sigma factor RsiW
VSVVHPSDLLAAYALDAVTDAERVEIQAHLVGCDQCRREVARHRAVTEVLAMSVLPEQPPTADLKERILRETTRTPQLRPIARQQRTLRRPALPSRLVGWLAAAVLLITSVGLGAWNLALREQLQLVSARPVPRVALAATADAPGAAGDLTIDSQGGALVTVSDLPQLGTGLVYEAWVIDANGPKPAGTFLTTSDGRGAIALTRPPAPGQIVAVTAEPTPGTTVPTGKVLLKGTLAASGS